MTPFEEMFREQFGSDALHFTSARQLADYFSIPYEDAGCAEEDVAGDWWALADDHGKPAVVMLAGKAPKTPTIERACPVERVADGVHRGLADENDVSATQRAGERLASVLDGAEHHLNPIMPNPQGFTHCLHVTSPTWVGYRDWLVAIPPADPVQ